MFSGILTGIIVAALIITPAWIIMELKVMEACRLLKGKRDQLLLRPEDRITNKEIDSFLRRYK